MSKKCPLCLKNGKKLTIEHIPARALYRHSNTGGADVGATIKICSVCNGNKSTLDNEMLALYGHLLYPGQPYAANAAMALKNPRSVRNVDDLALISGRFAEQTGIEIANVQGFPIRITTQWMNLVSRAIYTFFEGRAFVGRVVPCRQPIASQREMVMGSSGLEVKTHRINDLCSIMLLRRGREHPVAMVYFSPQDLQDSYIFFGVLAGDDTVRGLSKERIDEISKWNVRTASPNEIYDIKMIDGRIVYDGIKRQR